MRILARSTFLARRSEGVREGVHRVIHVLHLYVFAELAGTVGGELRGNWSRCARVSHCDGRRGLNGNHRRVLANQWLGLQA